MKKPENLHILHEIVAAAEQECTGGIHENVNARADVLGPGGWRSDFATVQRTFDARREKGWARRGRVIPAAFYPAIE